MTLYVGTSGYSYKEWKGSFYPETLPAKEMLAYYAACLQTVEINNTFYRRPRKPVLESWKQQVPPGFKFSVKAPQGITHYRRLKDAHDETKTFLETVAALGDRLGPILFQLPPNMKKDLDRLGTFLIGLPPGTRSAFEFRHPTWFDDDVLELLSKGNYALCISDTDDVPVSHIDKTADWGYLRLHRDKYSKENLKKWVKRMREQNWQDSFVFFKHEDECAGPKLAAQFMTLAGDTERER